jgi:N-glycosylase/DNA lyase
LFLPAIQPFKLELDWLRAQAFRWTEPNGDGWYYGVVHDSLIRVRHSGGGIEFESDASNEALAPHVTHYLRLDQDIRPIQKKLRSVDDTMARLVDDYDGLRILRQDPWECLVAYICSQQNEVDDIAAIVTRIANKHGTPLSLEGVTRHAFPSPRRLEAVSADALQTLAPGLSRGRRIHRIATDIASGALDLLALSRMPHAQARAALMSYDGIGAKIADCVSLFALDKAEAFPVDRHIARGLEPYGQKYTDGAPNAGLMQWVREKFGENAGYAGQLLFLDQGSKS